MTPTTPTTPAAQDFEKPGEFYLGQEYDLAAKRRNGDLVLYDSKDLVTHAVCVGMTGSGKTGLCIGLLEEAAIDGIPAIVIDPKGDLSNLLLTFPELSAGEFKDWVNEDDAKQAELSVDDYAAQQAEMWTKGLSDWGQDKDRVRKFRESAEFTIYTPGSTAGRPVNIVKSLGKPEQAIIDDHDLLQERISTTVTSLLGLMGIDADPIQSREHILLSRIFDAAWKDGHDLAIEALIDQIQNPPFQKVGVVELDEFYPERERTSLAMKLNNLLAAPGFATWLSGDPLDIGALLRTATKKPRVSIFSIAHLSDAERMFFVSMLLNGVIGWMRGQSGTTSLRAIVYMDEIFGYFPPVANPPSKGPLLTLMKQARAFGVGVVLATQNPVDIDYKGLSNAGTWLIGRLQTERDKLRVLDGLAGASAEAGVGFDRERMSGVLSSLTKRVFLLNNVHAAEPKIFQTRWTLSYLRGPLTRDQIKKFKQPPTAKTVTADEESTDSLIPIVPGNAKPASRRPMLPGQIRQAFLPLTTDRPANATLTYQPRILAFTSVYFQDTKSGLDVTKYYTFKANTDYGQAEWTASDTDWVDVSAGTLQSTPAEGASFAPVPEVATQPKNFDLWEDHVADAIYRNRRIELLYSERHDTYSQPDESEADFRKRLEVFAREDAAQAENKVDQKYATKLAAAREKVRVAQRAVDREAAQAKTSGIQTVISMGATVLNVLFSRKKLSAGNIGRATTTARGVGRSGKEMSDVARANEELETRQTQLAELVAEYDAALAAELKAANPATERLETIAIRPKKTNIKVESVRLVWLPRWQTADGKSTSA